MSNKRPFLNDSSEVSPPSKQMKDDSGRLGPPYSSVCRGESDLEIDQWRSWTTDELEQELLKKGLKDIAKLFKDEGISGSGLHLLDDKRLKSIGLNMGQILRVNNFFLDERVRSDRDAPEQIENHKVFNDPIHGHIELHPLCVKIIDTPQFQRLRFLKQLGMCYFVYPGASHNRFEHSIGVCHLAGQLVRSLHLRQPELNITREDILCVEIAGLCHDLGHGPFSHMFDKEFIPKTTKGRKWKHEEGSVAMFEHLIEANSLQTEFEKYGLTEKDKDFIKEQIKGPMVGQNQKEKWPYKGRKEYKSFLYEIVANKRNGIDVDKWDYFARDCHMLGIKNNFDHTRFMKFARVVKVEDQHQICVRDKEVNNLYDMFYTRNALHRRAYQHKVTTVLEIMMVEALIKANDFIFIPGENGEKRKMSECIDDMEAYTKLTDDVIQLIRLSTDPCLEPSQKIINKILSRNLYKCVGQSRPCKGFDAKDRDLRKEILDAMLPSDKDADVPLHYEDIVLHLVYLDYGMKEKNPIDYVCFYDKNNINEAIHLKKDQVSQLLPETFAEQFILVYCKDADPEKLGIASRCFTQWCQIHNMESPKQSAWEMTPVKKRESSSVSPCTPDRRDEMVTIPQTAKICTKLFYV